MIIDKLAEGLFYRDWQEKFNSHTGEYITPKNPKVKKASKRAVSFNSNTRTQRADDIWEWVYNNTEYKLSESWKTPEQTINESVGDCEDVTFLIASMLSSIGISGTKVVLGSIIGPEGNEEYHTWNTVDGRIYDGTASRNAMKKLDYVPKEIYTIRPGRRYE